VGAIHPTPVREPEGAFMENIVVGVISLLLFAYLLAAVIRPEKF
jgi:K+-transporting ATPase KdpF subunit